MIRITSFCITNHNYIRSSDVNRRNPNLKNEYKTDSVSFCGNNAHVACKIGEKLGNLGLIIAQPSLFNKKTQNLETCILVYLKSQVAGAMILLRDDAAKIDGLTNLLKNKPDIMAILVKHDFHATPKVLDEIRGQSPEFVDLYNDLLISEIAYRISPKEKAEKLIALGYKPDTKSDIFAVGYFESKQRGKYDRASMSVLFPLISAFKKNGVVNVVAKAQSIDKIAPCPFDMYAKRGFKPLYPPIAEIEASKISINGKKVIPPSVSVLGYLPEDAIIYTTPKNHGPCLDTIDKLKPNWFYEG